jgi:hypothetical protein
MVGSTPTRFRHIFLKLSKLKAGEGSVVLGR